MKRALLASGNLVLDYSVALFQFRYKRISIPIRRVFGVEEPEESVEFGVGIAAVAIAAPGGEKGVAAFGGDFADFARGDDEGRSGGLSSELDLAGPLEAVHADESLGDGFTASEEAVIAKDQDILVAEVGAEAGAFIEVEGGPFEVVVGDLFEVAQSVHGNGQESGLESSDGHAGDSMGMDDAADIGAHAVDGGVDDEAGGVDFLGGVAEDSAVAINLDEVGSGDFIETVAIGVDEKVVTGRGEPDGGVGPDEFVPTEVVDEAVNGGELDAEFLFFSRHGFDRLDAK
jgi:hypothetical protein